MHNIWSQTMFQHCISCFDILIILAFFFSPDIPITLLGSASMDTPMLRKKAASSPSMDVPQGPIITRPDVIVKPQKSEEIPPAPVQNKKMAMMKTMMQKNRNNKENNPLLHLPSLPVGVGGVGQPKYESRLAANADVVVDADDQIHETSDEDAIAMLKDITAKMKEEADSAQFSPDDDDDQAEDRIDEGGDGFAVREALGETASTSAEGGDADKNVNYGYHPIIDFFHSYRWSAAAAAKKWFVGGTRRKKEDQEATRSKK